MSVSISANTSERMVSSTGQRRRANTAEPEISLLLSTYQKPWHLRRVLASIAMQEHVADRMELIVTDDGSTDETADLVVRFAQSVNFPVRFTTHAHAGFQLARCRNEGVGKSQAPYLLFLDGDCLLPPDHVWQHLQHRRRGEVMGGYCVRLDREISENIDEDAIRTQKYLRSITRKDLRKLAVRDWKARFYRLLNHRDKPKLAGGNIGIWRSDYERVNGYDENFQGWGGEDDDLRRRLVRCGVKIGSILRWTRTYHLWHPPEPSAPKKASLGDNYGYLFRRGRLTRCRNGLVKRTAPEALQVRLSRHTELSTPACKLLADHQLPLTLPTERDDNAVAEVEFAFFPGTMGFDQQSDCKVLVVLSDLAKLPTKLLKSADLVITDLPVKVSASQQIRSLSEFAKALNDIS